MKYFLAYSFSALIDSKTGLVDEKNRQFLEDMRNSSLDKKADIFLAHFREKWGKELMTADECTFDDFKEMKESDVVLAFPGNPISGGVHIELGWASALNKKIYLFLEKNASYSPLIEGMKTITDVRIVELPENYTIETVLNAVEEI